MEDIEFEVLLEIVSGKIAGELQHQALLGLLLSSPVGAWRPVSELDPAGVLARECQSLSAELASAIMEGLKLAWLPNPFDPKDASYCALLFFYGNDERMWHSFALFNRATL